MVGTVYESSLEVNYRVACENTLLDRLLKSLLYCREVVLRNSSAEYLLLEYEIFCIVVRLELDPNVTVLTVTAGLLLMLTLNLNLLADSLTVRNLSVLENCVYLKLILELGNQNLKLNFTQAGDNHLLCLCVVLNSKASVLIHELLQAAHDLIFLTLLLRSDGLGKTGRRELDLRHLEDTGLVAQSIVCL